MDVTNFKLFLIKSCVRFNVIHLAFKTKYVTIILRNIKGEEMNLYEAVYARKSVRRYTSDPVSPKILDGLMRFYAEMEGLFGGVETELTILDNQKGKRNISGFVGVHAPYYLALYSVDQEKCMMNAGFVMQQLSLYLCSKGFGSCYVGLRFLMPSLNRRGNKRLVCLLAFGRARDSYARKATDARRLPMNEICTFKEKPRLWMNQLLDAARLAPSFMNAQPWRFVVYDNRIHVFSKKHKGNALDPATELDFGVLFSNMMVVAEELWLDVDLIRLEGISQKNFPNCQYVLSVILRA